MKTYKKIVILLILTLSIGACEDKILDLESLTEPTSASFFSTGEELELALNALYRNIAWFGHGCPVQLYMDNGGSDIGVNRGLWAGGFLTLGDGSIGAQDAGAEGAYTFFYKGIGRANNLLQNMDRAKDVVPAERFSEIQAEALVIRAYFYHYLTELWGDVPYIDFVPETPEESILPRTSKSTVVDNILADLQTASAILPTERSAEGRITKIVVLTLKARIELYNGRYSEAAASAKAVMDLEGAHGFSLHPDYEELFQLPGEGSSEILLAVPHQDGYFTTALPRENGSRNRGSWARLIPTQSMIDSYEASDGLPIDESLVYSPKQPFENRDPRLKASVITPQSEWAGLIFESHPDSLTFRNVDGTEAGANRDCWNVSWPAAFCGYLWRKNNDEVSQIAVRRWSEHDFILMRYAEVLLIYAEAKIEQGDIDASVLNAINRIRARAYGVDVTDTGNYPAITTTDQSELRRIIRRERLVELANEGFRRLDINRWRIAEKVMPVVIYGRILDPTTATGVPDIDEDGLVSYAGIESQYELRLDNRFPNSQNRIFINPRNYLLPIPQSEIDTYVGMGATLEQNPGY